MIEQKINNASLDLPSSFRDPSGFVFVKDGVIHRQINTIYKKNYEQLMTGGLYADLAKLGLLIPHNEITSKHTNSEDHYKTIQPKPIPYVSYPFEWSFSQLKDAALATLTIQKKALEFGMSLKDCSAYNIQFLEGRPIFIDTLSFEKYHKGQPWVAYRQFCQHFLAPLALMNYVDIRLNQLFRIYIDGIPLNLASSLLPFRTRLAFSLLSHIHLHAKSQSKFADRSIPISHRKMSRLGLLGLIDNLEAAIKKMNWKPQGTEWGNYYEDNSYSSKAMAHKNQLVARFLTKTNPKTVWDLGANTGFLSRIASKRGIQTICFDIDPAAVEKNYLQCRGNKEKNILPLLLDLTNPSPDIGWENQERMSFFARGPADTVLALALIHHLAISNNIPFPRIVSFFSKICNSLIIEFVPKSDSQAQRLLSCRHDIFPHYSKIVFEHEFSKSFRIRESTEVKDTGRSLYLMENRNNSA